MRRLGRAIVRFVRHEPALIGTLVVVVGDVFRDGFSSGVGAGSAWRSAGIIATGFVVRRKVQPVAKRAAPLPLSPFVGPSVPVDDSTPLQGDPRAGLFTGLSAALLLVADEAVVETCSTCRFARPGQEPDGLRCRRLPPAAVAQTVAFPTVGADDWCGEHQARPS